MSFTGSAKFIQILRTFYAPVRPGRHEPFLVVAGPPCGTICSFHFGHGKVSPLILRLGAAATLPALFSHIGAVILQGTFLHRHARRLRVASSRALAWQFPKMISILFGPRAATETSPGDPAKRGSVTFVSVAEFWSLSGPLYFGKPPYLMKKARLNAQEGTRPQPRSEFEGASASV